MTSLRGKKNILTLNIFEDGIRVNIREYLPSLPELGYPLPIVTLLIGNTGNSPLSLIREGGKEKENSRVDLFL